jgi:hypothetical protein
MTARRDFKRLAKRWKGRVIDRSSTSCTASSTYKRDRPSGALGSFSGCGTLAHVAPSGLRAPARPPRRRRLAEGARRELEVARSRQSAVAGKVRACDRSRSRASVRGAGCARAGRGAGSRLVSQLPGREQSRRAAESRRRMVSTHGQGPDERCRDQSRSAGGTCWRSVSSICGRNWPRASRRKLTAA